jgi:hypothetical protein
VGVPFTLFCAFGRASDASRELAHAPFLPHYENLPPFRKTTSKRTQFRY